MLFKRYESTEVDRRTCLLKKKTFEIWFYKPCNTLKSSQMLKSQKKFQENWRISRRLYPARKLRVSRQTERYYNMYCHVIFVIKNCTIVYIHVLLCNNDKLIQFDTVQCYAYDFVNWLRECFNYNFNNELNVCIYRKQAITTKSIRSKPCSYHSLLQLFKDFISILAFLSKGNCAHRMN